MALFKPSTWGIAKVKTDIENYRDWAHTIKREKANKHSKFNKWKLNHNSFYTVYFTYDVSEEESQIPENIMRLRMIESMAPLHRYFDEELGFAECLTPEFNNFINEETGDPTLTYLITYRFSFNKLSIWWVVKFLAKWGVLITAISIAANKGLFVWIAGLI
jgi:hypothetical protein